MRKSTKNKLTKATHVILIILTVFVALIASLYAAIRDVTVQSMIVRTAAGFASKYLNTEVKIKTFYITPKLEIHINDLQVNDLEQYPMFKIGELRTKLSYDEDIDLKLRDVYLKDAFGNLVTYEGNEMSNLSEILSQLGDNGEKTSGGDGFSLAIGKIDIENAHFILWNQNRDDPARKRMDYRHLDIDSINLDVHNFEYRNDTITGFIRDLKGKDRCGVDIKSFRASVLFCPTDINIGNLLVDLNDSHLDMNLEFKINDLADFKTFVDSVVIISNIRDTHLRLDDIRFWSTAMGKMPDDVVLNTDFRGPVNDFTLTNLDLSFGECSNIKGELTIKDVCRKFPNTYWIADFTSVVTNYEDLANFYIPASSVTIPVPEQLKALGQFSFSFDFKGSPVNFDFLTSMKTDIGDVDAAVMLKRAGEIPEYDVKINTHDLEMQGLISTTSPANISADLNLQGKGFGLEDADLKAYAHVNALSIINNDFENFDVGLSLKGKIADIKTSVANRNINLKLEAEADLRNKRPQYNAVAKIRNANLPKLHVIDNESVMLLSTNISVSSDGFSLDNLNANVNLDNTSYYDGVRHYDMEHLDASVSDRKGVKSVSVNCDFFDLQVDGIINHTSFVSAMKNTLLKHIDIPAVSEGRSLHVAEKQEFTLKLNMKDSDVLTSLFLPQLHVASGTSLTATFTTGDASHGQDFYCPEIRVNGVSALGVEFRNSIDREAITSEITVRDLILKDSTEKRPRRIRLENIMLNTLAQNDTLFFNLNWDNMLARGRNMADISARFVPHESSGGLLSVSIDSLLVLDTLVNLDENCFVDFRADRTVIGNLHLFTKEQAISVDGNFPSRGSDTLNVAFRKLDIGNVNIFTRNPNFILGGIIDGGMSVTGIDEQMSFNSGLRIDSLMINNRFVGDVSVDSYWDDAEKAITIDAGITGMHDDGHQKKSFELSGNYYPLDKEESLDLDMNVNNFHLNSIEPLVKSVIGRLDGVLDGSVSVTGSLSEPVLDGFLALNDAGVKINFLNTYYKMNDTVHLSENLIDLGHLSLLDTLGNNAVVSGIISHNYLKDYNLDVRLSCDDFAAMNIPAERAGGFYGSAIADGDILIKGGFDDILIDIDATTRRGTEISIPISGSNTVDDNFIVFVQQKRETDTVAEEKVTRAVKSSNLTLNLDAEVNPDAKLNIILPSNMGNINATGDGNINLGMKAGTMTLKGNYLINSGAFSFNLQVINRVFTIRNGGVISFNGDPTDADIDVVSSYRTKTSLKTLGGGIDTTMVGDNVPVDCILRLSNKLTNPVITFGVELPNVKDDVKTAVFSVIDTTNQTVMAQHVLSLLVLGSFANSTAPTLANIGSAAYYRVITGALNNWLSQLSKNFDIGVNYKPFSSYTNEEIEVALSTQLFDDRLTVEGNFGVIRGTNSTAGSTNDIVGDIDVTYKLSKILSLKAYNHTNTNNNSNYYSYENISEFTQGIGISISRSFDSFSDIFRKNKKKNKENNVTDDGKDNP